MECEYPRGLLPTMQIANLNRMVALAVLALTVFHPGLFLPSLRKGNKNVEAA